MRTARCFAGAVATVENSKISFSLTLNSAFIQAMLFFGYETVTSQVIDLSVKTVKVLLLLGSGERPNREREDSVSPLLVHQ